MFLYPKCFLWRSKTQPASRTTTSCVENNVCLVFVRVLGMTARWNMSPRRVWEAPSRRLLLWLSHQTVKHTQETRPNEQQRKPQTHARRPELLQGASDLEPLKLAWLEITRADSLRSKQLNNSHLKQLNNSQKGTECVQTPGTRSRRSVQIRAESFHSLEFRRCFLENIKIINVWTKSCSSSPVGSKKN